MRIDCSNATAWWQIRSQLAIKRFADVEKSWLELENTVLADSSSVFWSMPSGILWPASLKARGGEFGKFYSLPASTIQGLIDTAAILSNVQHMAISSNCLRVCKLNPSLLF
ncbi:hypothetical protein BS78_K219100 [Paspalum vaginatum]|uniref:Uncharacterized protein n=1 Tax=Paspalum vaginatum TaxID=158149 RepID=A0A9W7XAP5_9POAL|nr:hypothetical protein BS78_K219100 [Paspalum vaginatum]